MQSSNCKIPNILNNTFNTRHKNICKFTETVSVTTFKVTYLVGASAGWSFLVFSSSDLVSVKRCNIIWNALLQDDNTYPITFFLGI